MNERCNKPKKWLGKTIAILSLVFVVAGLGTLLYPHMRQYQYRRAAQTVISEYQQSISKYSEDELEVLYRSMVQYNQALSEDNQQQLLDPFAFEQVAFSLLDYGYEEELIGYLFIPAMEVELPVYLGAGRENLNRGAAHLTYTSLPVGGENTNAVIAAHRGMPTAAMFRDIERLQEGDLLYFTNFRETLVYTMTHYEVILPHEVDKVMIQEGKDLFTLLTCHPYGGNSYRYAAYFERVLDEFN